MPNKIPGEMTSDTSQPQRYPFIDAARGFAILLMFVYHFCFDLAWLGLADFDFYRGTGWLHFRSLIVTLFLGIMGVSLYLSTRHGIDWRRFGLRLAMIAGYAALVSLGSYLLFPDSMIVFGILHFAAVASVLGLLFIRFHVANLVIGIALILLGNYLPLPLFDQPALHWIGMMTHKPVTEDYVPLLPWFGVVLIGHFLGHVIFSRRRPALVIQWRETGWLRRTLCFGGRHSLNLYMVHQPIFLGLLYAGLWLSDRVAG